MVTVVVVVTGVAGIAGAVESYKGSMIDLRKDRNEYGDGVALWIFPWVFSSLFPLLGCMGIYRVDQRNLEGTLKKWRGSWLRRILSMVEKT